MPQHRTIADSGPEDKLSFSSPGRAVVKHVLACLDGTKQDHTVLEYALQIAQRFGSHIDVLHVRFKAHGPSSDQRRDSLLDRLLAEPLEHRSSEAGVRARESFDEWRARYKLPLLDCGMAAQGHSTHWREIVGDESEVIARLGRLSDLIVVGRGEGPGSSSSALVLETALFDSSRPVLLVPELPIMNLFHRPLVAWNGSREAARAIGFALPFLSEFEGCVGVFAAPESKHCTDTTELLRYLGWHGIVAQQIAAEASSGSDLLAKASAYQSGLIVMGAYTHGHYRQFLFGGMTRHIIEHAAIPVLLAH